MVRRMKEKGLGGGAFVSIDNSGRENITEEWNVFEGNQNLDGTFNSKPLKTGADRGALSSSQTQQSVTTYRSAWCVCWNARGGKSVRNTEKQPLGAEVRPVPGTFPHIRKILHHFSSF